jgi:hypothetical protein
MPIRFIKLRNIQLFPRITSYINHSNILELGAHNEH